MEAAALVLLAAGVGIGYGWQPMPDGTSRYEYVVQIEPEMLAALGENETIPIVSEVPEHVRPIGRIRIVVGTRDLPRERLVTRMKPAGEAAPTGGSPIELAQYNEYDASGGRYGQPQPAVSPDAASWNGGAAQPAAPAGGTGSSWNDAPISVAERTDAQGPMARVGDHIDDATAPLRQGLERVDDKVRNAVGNLGERTRNLVDELGRPFQPQSNPAGARAPLGADPNNPAAPTWNADAATGGAAPSPRYQDQGSSWNNDDARTLPEAPPFAAPAPGSDAVRFGQNAEAGSAPGGSNWNPGSQSPSSQRLDQPIDPRDVGRWDNAAPAAGQAGRGAGGGDSQAFAAQPTGRDGRATADAGRAGADATRNPAGFPTGPTFEGPRLPSFENAAAADKPDPFGDSTSRDAAADAGSPKIDSRMLRQPASRPLEGAEASQAASGAAGPAFPAAQGPAFPGAHQRPANGSPQTPNSQTTAAAGQGWDLTRTAANQPGASQAAATGSGRQAAATLFAWVLLTGSAAGNLYLFWSYQDVRYKYRSLVRKSARAVGSRFSAA